MFRIMIVEDEPPISRNIAEMIKEIDPEFKVVGIYGNGEDALLELKLVKPHVLLTDIHMPIMDGLTLIERVKQLSPEVFCSILSGYQDFDYARKAVRLGVSDYLLKPPTNEIIKDFLDNIKRQLMNDQSLIEAELLKWWSSPNSAELHWGPSKIKALTQEYFYFASYILVYVWWPEALSFSLANVDGMNLGSQFLTPDEKQYEIQTPLDNEHILLFGIHGLDEQRLQKLSGFCERHYANKSLSFTLTPLIHGLTEIAAYIKKARKQANLINKIGEVSVSTLNASQTLPVPGKISIPLEMEHSLLSFLERKKEIDFLNELENLLDLLYTKSSYRIAWQKTMHSLMQTLQSHLKATHSANITLLTINDHELAEIIEQASDYRSLVSGLKEWFSHLLSNEGEKDESQWVDELEQFLQSHYRDNIALSDLSDAFHLNPKYLSRVFKRKKNQSPLDYLANIRIEEAKRLIRYHPRLLLKDIAEQVGHTDPFYFSKLFKQYSGYTPTEYRKSLK